MGRSLTTIYNTSERQPFFLFVCCFFLNKEAQLLLLPYPHTFMWLACLVLCPQYFCAWKRQTQYYKISTGLHHFRSLELKSVFMSLRRSALAENCMQENWFSDIVSKKWWGLFLWMGVRYITPCGGGTLGQTWHTSDVNFTIWEISLCVYSVKWEFNSCETWAWIHTCSLIYPPGIQLL